MRMGCSRAAIAAAVCALGVGCFDGDAGLTPSQPGARRTIRVAGERRSAPSAAPDESAPSHDAAASDAGARSAATNQGSDDVGRPILRGAVENARDLGGIPLENDRFVAPDSLYRGAPLSDLSSEGCAEFERLGIRTVIDLRIEPESELAPESACVARRARLVSAPLPIPYNVSPADYIADLDTSESIVAIFGALADASQFPVYFHCTWGRDRTGVTAAIILLALGASTDAIMQDYLLSLDSVGAYPKSLAAALDEIERRGGIERYLSAAGVSREQISALRARAIGTGD